VANIVRNQILAQLTGFCRRRGKKFGVFFSIHSSNYRSLTKSER